MNKSLYNFDLDNDIEDVSISDTIYPIKQKINKDFLEKDKNYYLYSFYEKNYGKTIAELSGIKQYDDKDFQIIIKEHIFRNLLLIAKQYNEVTNRKFANDFNVIFCGETTYPVPYNDINGASWFDKDELKIRSSVNNYIQYIKHYLLKSIDKRYYNSAYIIPTRSGDGVEEMLKNAFINAENYGFKSELWNQINCGTTLILEKKEVINESTYIAYHGSPCRDIVTGKFKKGRHGHFGPAIYFSEEKEYTTKYARKYGSGAIYTVEISIDNPLILTTFDSVKELLTAIYGSESIYNRRMQNQTNENYIVTAADLKKLQNKGYDGIIWDYAGNKEFVVFDNSQIKILDRENI